MSPQRPCLHVNQLWSDTIAEELARSGVRHAVISPGSRSTPLVLALASHPDITDHSVIDERSAGFFAMGLARATAQPVVLLCTSGTAAANYFPAVCEADRARVPLLLLTADRPAHLRDSGAPQTMDQVKLYGDRVRWYADAGQPEADETRLRALRASVCYAVACARDAIPGPVHVNVPFRKPLEPAPPEHAADAVNEALLASRSPGIRGRTNGRAWSRWLHGATRNMFGADVPGDGTAEAADALLRARRPVIVAGPDADGAAYAPELLAFAQEFGIPLMAEAASQLRYHGNADVIATADLLLRSEAFRARFHPDCILRTGGADTNTQMQRFMESLDDAEVIQLAPDLRRQDPSHAVSLQVVGDIAASVTEVASVLRAGRPVMESGWNEFLFRGDAAARDALPKALGEMRGAFEGGYIHALGTMLPEGSAMFVSSSMPIRDVETFLPSTASPVDLAFNRGINGIDGVVSSALGTARGRGGRTVLLVGDIAFLHNLNAVYGSALREMPLTIVLLNNNGGEIFELLPVRDFDPEFTRHFITPQHPDIATLAAGLGIFHRSVEEPASFPDAFAEALALPGIALIEIRTDIRSSGTQRRNALRKIADDVARAIEAAGEAISTETSPSGTVQRSFPLAWRMYRRGIGTPAVFLHGFTRSGRSWEHMLSPIADRTCITVDLMGHGRSPVPDAAMHPTVYELEYASDRLEELLDRLGLARVHLVGYSMGGRTAMVHAARYPGRIASLALVSANPGIEDASERESRRERDDSLAERIMEGGLEAFVREWSAQPMFASQERDDPSLWRRAMQDRMRQRSAGLASALRGSGQGRQEPVWEALASFAFPACVAAGERDGGYADIARRMRDILPDCTLRVFEGAGHDLLFDRPSELLRDLTELWKRS